MVVTDTIPLNEKAQACSKIQVLSIAELVGEAIVRSHTGDSVTSRIEVGGNAVVLVAIQLIHEHATLIGNRSVESILEIESEADVAVELDTAGTKQLFFLKQAV